MNVQAIVVGQLGANCYLVIDECTRESVVIDPGDDTEVIVRAVRDSESSLKHIILTHGHPDHSFAVGELQESFPGALLMMNEADAPELRGDPGIVVLFYDVSQYVEPRIGTYLSDGDVVRIGETELRAIHTPGHTPGGMCYLSGRMCFTGDTLFAGGIGRTDFVGGSTDNLMRSIHEKLLTLPGDTIILPGHGPTSTIEMERRTNPWLQG